MMTPITDIALRQIEIYSIIFLRVSGIIFTMPFFGSENVPRVLRIGLSLVITIVLVPALNIDSVVLPENIVSYVVVLFKELLVGMALGYIAMLIFHGIQFAGNLVGFQMGLQGHGRQLPCDPDCGSPARGTTGNRVDPHDRPGVYNRA